MSESITKYPCGKIYADVEQGKPEWFAIKCGIISGSRMADVMQEKKGTGYENYLAQLACERLTNCVTPTFKNDYMDRGSEDESPGRECFEFITGYTVEQVAFIKHPFIENFGISPDGLICAAGMCEIKRKIPALHQKYLREKRVPPEYLKQMHSQMACSGREWNIFVSYCPEMPAELQIFQCRLERDDHYIKEIESSVIQFDKEVEKRIAELKALIP